MNKLNNLDQLNKYQNKYIEYKKKYIELKNKLFESGYSMDDDIIRQLDNVLKKYNTSKDDMKKYYDEINDVYVKNKISLEKPTVKYTDIKKRFNYSDTIPGLNLHVGQRKLFLSELQFLTKVHQNENKINYTPFVIYAGAAAGHHTYHLTTHFPNMKFILIDPNPFCLFLEKRICHTEKKNDKVVYLHFNKLPNRAQINKDNLKYINFYDRKKKIITNDFDTIISQSSTFYDIDNKQLTDFIINSKYKIFLINDYMSIKLSKKLKKINAYFISDIRTAVEGKRYPTDIDTIWNQAQQLNWIKILKPAGCMLKFKQPYYDMNVKDIINYFNSYLLKEDIEYSKKLGFVFTDLYQDKKFHYFDGDIYLQAFAPEHSTETRLVFFRKLLIDKINKKTKFDQLYDFKIYGGQLEYEEKLFYHNIINRTFRLYENHYIMKDIGFDNCSDCALEAHIWEEYSKHIKEIDIKKSIKQLCYILNRYLNIKGHGLFFQNFNKKNLEKRLSIKINYNK